MRFFFFLLFFLILSLDSFCQTIITYHSGSLNATGDGFVHVFWKIDLANCEQEVLFEFETALNQEPFSLADIGYAPDGYIYALGPGNGDLFKIDLNQEEIVATWSIPSHIQLGGMFINSEGLILMSGQDGWMVTFDIYTEELTVLGMLDDSFPYRLTLFALAEYRGRIFGSLVSGHLVEIFLDEMRAEYIMRSAAIEQSLYIYEEECGVPIFITGVSGGKLRLLDPVRDTFYTICEYEFSGTFFSGITSFTEYQENPDCRDTIDLNSTLPGFDHFVINDCGESRAFIADDSARVYGAFPMDSIRVRIVEEPIDAEGSLVAPNPLLGVVSGSGSEELLASGTMEFNLWESWLRQVEYVDSSDPPALGLRRIAVIGYYHGGERTDTAWSEIEILTHEFSAGLGGEFEECPSGETVNLFNYLSEADEGGYWEPDFSDGEIALLPQHSGTYYYIIDHPECGSDTARVDLFIWPGPDVEISGGGIYCEGSTIMLELQGDVGDATSLLWNTGSSADRIEVTESGTYWLRMVYGEDCIWTDTVLVDFQERTVVEAEMGLCPTEEIEWHGQQITEVGQYETILSGIDGDCDTLLQLTVVESDYINTDLSREICPGETFEINGTVFSEAGEFELVLSANEGCDTLLTIVVVETEFVNTNLSRAICPGESFEINGTVFSEPGEFELILPANEGCDTLLTIAIDWSEDIEKREAVKICPGETFEFQGEFLTVPGQYEFVIESASGCDTLLIVYLEEKLVAEVQILGPDRVCEGEEVTLTASPLDELQQIFWNTGEAGNQIRVSEGGQYDFEALTLEECMVSAEKWIEQCPSRRVYIPNAFSPNSDGVNDVWTVYAATESIEFEVQIFDRWGSKVFEQRGNEIAWDGIYRNELLPAGTYVFILRLLFLDGEMEERSGEILLVR